MTNIQNETSDGDERASNNQETPRGNPEETLDSLKTVLIDLRRVLENQRRARISQRKILTTKTARGAPVIYGCRFIIKTSLSSIDTLG